MTPIWGVFINDWTGNPNHPACPSVMVFTKKSSQNANFSLNSTSLLIHSLPRYPSYINGFQLLIISINQLVSSVNQPEQARNLHFANSEFISPPLAHSLRKEATGFAIAARIA